MKSKDINRMLENLYRDSAGYSNTDAWNPYHQIGQAMHCLEDLCQQIDANYTIEYRSYYSLTIFKWIDGVERTLFSYDEDGIPAEELSSIISSGICDCIENYKRRSNQHKKVIIL